MAKDSKNCSLFPHALETDIVEDGLLAVVTLDHTRHALPLAKALLGGGIRVMELAWRTPAALDCLHVLRSKIPEMRVGMGTLLNPEQLHQAQKADAVFGVSPGLTVELLEVAQALKFPYAPGVLTPSEVQLAVVHGCRLLKYFPAESGGGIAHLKSMNAPFAHLGLRYIVLGGLNESNAATYLNESCVGVLGGSWIAPVEMIRRENWEEIRSRAGRARELVDRAKGDPPSNG